MRHVLALVSAMTAGVLVTALVATTQDAGITAQVALGDSVFQGRVGGALCYVCHGPAGKGIPGLGPNLTDKEWLHGDGSVASIEKIIADGVAKPKKMPAPMPPRGGGQLTESQVKAAAAYVYSISQPAKKP